MPLCPFALVHRRLRSTISITYVLTAAGLLEAFVEAFENHTSGRVGAAMLFGLLAGRCLASHRAEAQRMQRFRDAAAD